MIDPQTLWKAIQEIEDWHDGTIGFGGHDCPRTFDCPSLRLINELRTALLAETDQFVLRPRSDFIDTPRFPGGIPRSR